MPYIGNPYIGNAADPNDKKRLAEYLQYIENKNANVKPKEEVKYFWLVNCIDPEYCYSMVVIAVVAKCETDACEIAREYILKGNLPQAKDYIEYRFVAYHITENKPFGFAYME